MSPLRLRGTGAGPMTAADDLRDYHADLDRLHGHEPER